MHAKWGQSYSLDIIKWHARVHKIVPGASSQPRPGSCLQTQLLGQTVKMGKKSRLQWSIIDDAATRPWSNKQTLLSVELPRCVVCDTYVRSRLISEAKKKSCSSTVIHKTTTRGFFPIHGSKQFNHGGHEKDCTGGVAPRAYLIRYLIYISAHAYGHMPYIFSSIFLPLFP
jgi:hypothetical protein